MRAVFSDLLKNEYLKKFNITKEEVIETLSGPDEVKKISLRLFDELIFYLKKHQDYFLLVDGRLKGDNFTTNNAYKIYPSLMKEFDTKEPLQVLEKFAQKYGLSMKIGGFEEKFIAGDSFPVGIGQDPQNMINILNPQNHTFSKSMMMIVRNEGQFQHIDVSIAYCIDTTEYLKYLSDNSS